MESKPLCPPAFWLLVLILPVYLLYIGFSFWTSPATSELSTYRIPSPAVQEYGWHSHPRGLSEAHLAVSVCGSRLHEALTLVTSVLLYTPGPLHIHAFVEKKLQSQLNSTVRSCISKLGWAAELTVYNIHFPASSGKDPNWKTLFRPCAALRLFFPSLLTVERVIYLDTDTLVVSDLHGLWETFSHFSGPQAIGLVNNLADGIYITNGTLQRRDRTGYNSGVVLMDLGKLRVSGWERDMARLYQQYRQHIQYGDQCLINIYTALHPDRVFNMTCWWHFCTDYCAGNQGRLTCPDAATSGISLLHGNRLAFHQAHDIKVAAFKTVYDVFQPTNSSARDALSKLTRLRTNSSYTYCDSIYRDLDPVKSYTPLI